MMMIMMVFIVIYQYTMKYKNFHVSKKKRKGVTQFNIMMSVLCPSVIQRQIDCMFMCCTVPIATSISCSLIILEANQTVVMMYVTKINYKIVACVSVSFMTLSVLLHRHGHACMYILFLQSHSNARRSIFLVICCCCKMRDVTCVYVSFVRLVKSNSIVKLN